MNEFVWVDLSTFDLKQAHRFYSAVLGWSYQDEGARYTTAVAKYRAWGFSRAWHAAGLYPMPDFFRKINMPSFWMSYIQVADIEATVAKAADLGAKIELQEENAFGRIALIRDPIGAGFTCIQNNQMQSARGNDHGMFCHNELVISDLALIQPFYEGLFGWSLHSAGHNEYTIHHGSAQPIATVQVASNDIKGDKEYWAVYFAVRDLDRAARHIEQAGGAVVYRYSTESVGVLVAHDDQGAAFHLMAAG